MLGAIETEMLLRLRLIAILKSENELCKDVTIVIVVHNLFNLIILVTLVIT